MHLSHLAAAIAAATLLAACDDLVAPHPEASRRGGADEIVGVSGPVQTGYVLDEHDQPQAVTFVVWDGHAIVGGDMDFGPAEGIARTPEEARALRSDGAMTPRFSNYRPGPAARWPDNGTHIIIPYVKDGTWNGYATQWGRVQAAIDKIHAQSRVRFVPRTNQADYVIITRGNDFCSVGRRGGAQYCRPSGNYWQVAMHELGHAIGLQHEHQRSDRDGHIRVFLDRTARDGEFVILSSTDASRSGGYDFNSVMHYGPAQFSTGGHTIEPNFTTYPGAKLWSGGSSCSDTTIRVKPLTCRTGFSAGDVDGINAMYGGSSAPTRSYVSFSNGRCLDAPSAANGTRVHMWDCLGASHPNQRWAYNAATGELKIHGNKCLDAWGARRLDPIVVHDCHGGGNQKWDIGTFGQIRLRGIADEAGRPMCIDISHYARGLGAQMVLQYCHRGDNQAWRSSAGGVGGATFNLWSDITRCADAPSAATGTQLHMWDCSATNPNQRFTRTASGEMRIHGKCLDAHASQPGNPAKVWDCHGGANQKWIRDPSGRLSPDSNRGVCLDVSNSSSFNGSKLILYSCHDGGNQRWTYTEPYNP
ncbi:MAG TPA: ricin-type beta-trefoil lectin domain protein [Longimicrobium sp.]|nr:ricin-type beta-trefoil lectin domain protein [Longimicrobium sp.]